MFGWDQKDRLLRESWTADALAQELYAMFGANVPANTNGPVSVTSQNNKVAPITLTNTPDGSPIFNIKRVGFPDQIITIIGGQWFDNGVAMNPPGGGGGGGSIVPVWG